MKKVSMLRILSFVLLLSLLLLGIPSAPVLAAREIELSPEEGTIGTRVTISGTDFNRSTADTDKYAAIYFSSDEAGTLDDIGEEVIHYKLVRDVWLDEEGDFETTFQVPSVLDDGSREEDVTSGTYYVYVCHYVGTIVQTRIRAVATFTVNIGEISLFPSRGTVDTMVEIRGSEFDGSRGITIRYDGSAIPIYSGDKQTTSLGEFLSVIRVPESNSGAHIITAAVSGDEARANFTVDPEIVVSPASGQTGSSAIVSGTGFDQLKTVTLWFYNTQVASTATNSLGTFYANFLVPDLEEGLYSVDAEESTNVAKAKFTITAPPEPEPPAPPPPAPTPGLSISATTGSVGQGIVMGGSGFKANSTVTIKYDNELLTAVTTDASGVFAAAFSVPISEHGTHVITASDGENITEINFDVESTPPPIPSLLLPQTESRVVMPVNFDWQSVTDPSSPVTYTLQIATSSDFSSASIVLEKDDLATTEYTPTETERLRLAPDERPYYWRVMATDSASNQGNWTNPWAFYVSSGGLPVWAIIVIAVLGGILLLAIGYLLRMKTSLFNRNAG